MKKCPVCGKQPKTFSLNIAGPGSLTIKAWVTECEGSDLEGESFIEHSVDVYGNNEKESKSRWQEMAGIQDT